MEAQRAARRLLRRAVLCSSRRQSTELRSFQKFLSFFAEPWNFWTGEFQCFFFEATASRFGCDCCTLNPQWRVFLVSPAHLHVWSPAQWVRRGYMCEWADENDLSAAYLIIGWTVDLVSGQRGAGGGDGPGESRDSRLCLLSRFLTKGTLFRLLNVYAPCRNGQGRFSDLSFWSNCF